MAAPDLAARTPPAGPEPAASALPPDHDLEPGVPPACPPGHPIAPGYQVIEHVRRGSDLDSYEAWSSQRHCRCFLKTLRPDRAADRSARRHLRREARLLLALSHPHLVRAYEFIQPQASRPPVLVLENLTGATLSYLLDGAGRLSSEDLGNLGQHLCSALRYLHGTGHLHLDVKPSNIIAVDGVARLIDLSLARPPGPAHPGIGTQGYMAPEQVSGGVLGPPADVWGLGLVLYEAATGNTPFDLPYHPSGANRSVSTLSRYEAMLIRPIRRVRAYRRLPTEVAHLIDACLHQDPRRRPTLGQLAASLATLTPLPDPPPARGTVPSRG